MTTRSTPSALAAGSTTRTEPRGSHVIFGSVRGLIAIAVFGAFLAQVVITTMIGSPAVLRVMWQEPFVLGAIGGVLAAYAGWERGSRALRIAGVATLLGLTIWTAAILAGWWLPPAYALLWVPGLVGLGGLLWRVQVSKGRARALWLSRLRDGLVIPLGVAVTPFMLVVSADLILVLDLYVLAFEDALGARFSHLAVSIFKALPWFGQPALIAYFLLPAGIAFAMAALERTKPPIDVIVAFAALTVVGYSLYWVFPVVGPQQLFGRFPFAYPPAGTFDVRAVELHLIAPRNGMPSLHAAWALMIWFVAGGAGPLVRNVLRVFAGLNLAATMGAEDAHWITDIIVAVPMTVAVCAAVMATMPWRGIRLATVVVGTALTAAAMGVLVSGVPVFRAMPWLSWLVVAVTVVPPLLLNARLWRAARDRRRGLASRR